MRDFQQWRDMDRKITGNIMGKNPVVIKGNKISELLIY